MPITLPMHDTDNTILPFPSRHVMSCQVRPPAELEPQAAGARGWATDVCCILILTAQSGLGYSGPAARLDLAYTLSV